MSVLKVDGDSCSLVSECFGGFCNSGACASSAPSSPSPSSSSSGGGGGGTVATAQSIKVTITDENKAKITIRSISANTVQNIPVNETYIVQKISIKPTETLKNVEIKIERVPPLENIPHPTGEVFEYLKVDEINITNNQTDVANITFKISKTWVAENNINISTVSLTRYTTQWDKLTTIKVNETTSDLIYTAISPGLSVFAIIGETIKPTEEKQEKIQEMPATEKLPAEIPAQEELKSKIRLLVTELVITVIAFGVTIYIIIGNKLHKEFKQIFRKLLRLGQI